jgi:hypothetical protein
MERDNMYGIYTMRYGKAYLVQQCKTQQEAEQKCIELDPSNAETGTYFIRKY